MSLRDNLKMLVSSKKCMKSQIEPSKNVENYNLYHRKNVEFCCFIPNKIVITSNLKRQLSKKLPIEVLGS